MDTKPIPSGIDARIKTTEVLADDCVLIVGGGPVGLLNAAVLAFYDIPSVIIERNSDTTRYGSILPSEWGGRSKDRDKMSENASDSPVSREGGLRWT